MAYTCDICNAVLGISDTCPKCMAVYLKEIQAGKFPEGLVFTGRKQLPGCCHPDFPFDYWYRMRMLGKRCREGEIKKKERNDRVAKMIEALNKQNAREIAEQRSGRSADTPLSTQEIEAMCPY